MWFSWGRIWSASLPIFDFSSSFITFLGHFLALDGFGELVCSSIIADLLFWLSSDTGFEGETEVDSTLSIIVCDIDCLGRSTIVDDILLSCS